MASKGFRDRLEGVSERISEHAASGLTIQELTIHIPAMPPGDVLRRAREVIEQGARLGKSKAQVIASGPDILVVELGAAGFIGSTAPVTEFTVIVDPEGADGTALEVFVSKPGLMTMLGKVHLNHAGHYDQLIQSLRHAFHQFEGSAPPNVNGAPGQVAPRFGATVRLPRSSPFEGLEVTAVAGGSAAQRLGIAPGSVLLSLAGTPLIKPSDLGKIVAARGLEDSVEVVWRHAGQQQVAQTSLRPLGPASVGTDAATRGRVSTTTAPAAAPGSGPRFGASARLPSVPPFLGLVVTKVVPGSVADRVGLVVGAVLTSIGDTDLAADPDLPAAVRRVLPGTSVDVHWLMGRQPHSATVTLG